MNQPHVLTESLCHVLGNTCRIYRTTKSYEWNVRGAGAVIAETCFARQATEMWHALDVLAQHALGLGIPAVLDYSDEVVEINPPTADAIPNLKNMLHNLAGGHRQANLSIGAGLDIAHDAYELPTVHILATRLEAHRTHCRRLLMVAESL